MIDKLPQERLTAVINKLENWCGDDACIVFPYITDLHSALENVDTVNSQKRETISDILLLNRVAGAAGADFCANLGDVGIDVPVKEEQELKELVTKCLEYHTASPVRPVLFAVGNHDVKKGFTPAFWGKEFRKINGGCSGMVYACDGEYGFYDIPEKKSRIFWLNCNPVPGHYTEEQALFIEKHLADLPQEWCVITLQHICLHNRGRWMKYRPVPEIYGRLHNVFAAFVKNGGIFAGFFTGDSHFCTTACDDGVNYCVSQGYGGIGPNERPPHAERSDVFSPEKGFPDSFDSGKECLIELVAVNPAKRKTAVFRIGAGESTFDRFMEF